MEAMDADVNGLVCVSFHPYNVCVHTRDRLSVSNYEIEG